MIPRVLLGVAVGCAALLTLGLTPGLVPGTAAAATDRYTREIYYTGYSWYDNDPPGSAEIAFARSYGYPTVHDRAAGVGTWTNPTTLAVTRGSDGRLLWAPGTRVYVPFLHKYAVVEDVAGAPGERADLWINGRWRTPEFADACMSRITGFRRIVVNPGPARTVTRNTIATWCATTPP